VKHAGTSTGLGSWWLSILLHVLVVALVAGAWFWYRSPPQQEQRLAIEASVVTSVPAQPAASAQPAPEPVAEPDPEPVPDPEPEPDAAAAEAVREAEAARVAEAERVAEQRRVAEARLTAQRKAEEVAKEKADREKKEREQKERDKAEQLKAQRQKEERDKAEQLRKQREQAEMEARLQRETELNSQLAAEQRVAAARAGAAGQQYIRQITARIEGAWKRPPGATSGTQCEVRVTQIRGGAVIDVQVVRCNRDETVRQSIEDAVYRASPLPEPSDPALFDRNLTITFRPEN
jgi:colicin import membrane protein